MQYLSEIFLDSDRGEMAVAYDRVADLGDISAH